MDIHELNKNLSDLHVEEYESGRQQPIMKFADLTPKETNLVCVIWVDGPRNMKHGRRIKFQNNTANKLNGGELIPITISDSPDIPDKLKSKVQVKQKEVNRIKQWILLNKQVLIDYADGKITTGDLYKSIQPLND